jgi:hypothetical protein
MKMEDCIVRNKDVLNEFFETDEGKKYMPVAKSFQPYVTTLRSEGFENLVIIISVVNSLHVLIVNTEGSGKWLGSLSRQLSDSAELVAYNLAYLLYKKINPSGQTK